MRQQRAFSLIEVLIALSLMMLLILFAFPSLLTLQTQWTAKIVARNLITAIQAAQQEAMLLNAPLGLCSSQTGIQCAANDIHGFLLFKMNDDFTLQQNLFFFKNHTGWGQLNWRAYPRYRSYLLFSPNGMLGDDATFWYCAPFHKTPSWALFLSQTNRLRFEAAHGQTLKDAEGHTLTC